MSVIDNSSNGNTDKLVRLIPKRAGSKPAGHSLTTFDHVRLPSLALLGSLSKPADMRASFLSAIGRVGIGTAALSFIGISILKVAAYIAGTYSLRRMVSGPDGNRVPIINFRTQQGPILHALAEIEVFEAYGDDLIDRYTREDNQDIQHALGTCFKTALATTTQARLYQLSERCGAQGLFKFNQIIELQLEFMGVSIAEGDILALCIRKRTDVMLELSADNK